MSALQHDFTAATESLPALGRVIEISGANANVSLDARMLAMLSLSGDMQPASIGSHVKLLLGGKWVVAQVRNLRLAEADGDLILGAIDLVGEGEDDDGRLADFRRGVSSLPMPGCRVYPTTADDLANIFATDARPHITIGSVLGGAARDGTRLTAALYVDSLLGRHFAILGSTGTGKSSTTALILHRICAASPNAHVLMIDPHGEYAEAFRTTGAIFDAANLAIPYWLMNLEEHAEVFVTAQGPERGPDIDLLARCLLAARLRNRLAEGISRLTADSPIPYLLSDLSNILQQEMGKLDRGGTTTAPYLRLKGRIDEVRNDPRYGFMFSGMLVGDVMAPFLSRMLRLGDGDQPIAIVDLSAVPSEITPVVVSLLARLVFDHALWSRGADQRPVLLVCEEAHRYIPQESWSPARRVLERIAKEGRKYGVSLGLISQRPSDLAEGVLSQCGTIVAMRLNNERDQAHVRAAVPEGARGLIDSIPALRNREAVVVGEGVSIPFRVAFDTLEPDQLPASRDPSFAEMWRTRAVEPARLERTIKRWRAQGR